MLQNILEAESEYSRELQSLLGTYLRSLHPTDRLMLLTLSHFDTWQNFIFVRCFDTFVVNHCYKNRQNLIISHEQVCMSVCLLAVLWLYRLSSVDINHIQGNLEEISTFQQMLVQSFDEQTKSVFFFLHLLNSFILCQVQNCLWLKIKTKTWACFYVFLMLIVPSYSFLNDIMLPCLRHGCQHFCADVANVATETSSGQQSYNFY